MSIATLRISDKFKSIIPALRKEEYDLLEKSILEEGVREAIVVWNDTIIDGHNRYDIATKHGIPFDTREVEFESELHVEAWMCLNQLSRRNLADYPRFELSKKRKEILAEIGRAKKLQTLKQGDQAPDLSNIDKTEEHNTQKQVSEELGWSTGKYAMAEVVDKKAGPELKEQLRNDEISINKAYQKVKAQEKKDKVSEKVEDAPQGVNQVDIFNTDQKFSIIYADPPWDYWSGGMKNQSLHYPPMTIDEIKALPVNDISDDNALLFIWVTFPILKESLEVIEAWGFTYSTCAFNWVKRNKSGEDWFFGLGSWTRSNSEICLLAKKGQMTRLSASVSQVLDDPIGEHSAKPKRVRGLIEQLAGKLPRIELFSRNNAEDGWYNWGNGI